MTLGSDDRETSGSIYSTARHLKGKGRSPSRPIDVNRPQQAATHSFSGADIKVYMRIPNFTYRDGKFADKSVQTKITDEIQKEIDEANTLLGPPTNRSAPFQAYEDQREALHGEINTAVEDRRVSEKALTTFLVENQLFPPFIFAPNPSQSTTIQLLQGAIDGYKETENTKREELKAFGDLVTSKAFENAKTKRLLGYDATSLDYYNNLNDQQSSFISASKQGTEFRKLDEIQTLSISSHIGYGPVRVLGETSAVDYVTGPRTVAGTMVFTVFSKNVFDSYYFIEDPSINFPNFASSSSIERLPKFHLIILAVNEYGSVSQAGLKNIQLMNFGTTFSVDDMFTETTYSFVAEDYQDLTDRDVKQFFNMQLDENGEFKTEDLGEGTKKVDDDVLTEIFGKVFRGGFDLGKSFFPGGDE